MGEGINDERMQQYNLANTSSCKPALSADGLEINNYTSYAIAKLARAGAIRREQVWLSHEDKLVHKGRNTEPSGYRRFFL